MNTATYFLSPTLDVCVIAATISTEWMKKRNSQRNKRGSRYKGFHYQSELLTILHRSWLRMGSGKKRERKKMHFTLTLTTIKFVLVVDKRRNHRLAYIFCFRCTSTRSLDRIANYTEPAIYSFSFSPSTQNQMVCISHCCVCFFNLTLWHWLNSPLFFRSVLFVLFFWSIQCSLFISICTLHTNQCDCKLFWCSFTFRWTNSKKCSFNRIDGASLPFIHCLSLTLSHQFTYIYNLADTRHKTKSKKNWNQRFFFV